MCLVVIAAAVVFFGVSGISAVQLLNQDAESPVGTLVVGFIGGTLLVWLYSTVLQCR